MKNIKTIFSLTLLFVVLTAFVTPVSAGITTVTSINQSFGDTISLGSISSNTLNSLTVAIDDSYASKDNPYDIDSTGLAAYYHMDSVSGTVAVDSSGNGKNGTVTNTTFSSTQGKYNNAIDLDGVNDYVSCPSINASHNTVLANNVTNLTIPTYDGSGEAVHPSVEYFPDGWNGYKYWMAMTPYPLGNYSYENPSIVASNDGINWEVPAGVVNPLFPLPAAGHNNDADLAYNPATDTLHLYWLDTKLPSECVGYEAEPWYDHNFLMEINTTDGVTWSDPLITKDWNTSVEPLKVSPAISVVNNVYYCYMMCSNSIERMTSADGKSWSAPTPCTGPYAVWHTDIKYIPEHNEWIGEYCKYGTGSDLFFISSTDGLNFTIYPSILLENNATAGAWDGTIYRTTFIYDNETDHVKFWYSAYRNTVPKNRATSYIEVDYTNLKSAVTNPERKGLTIACWCCMDAYPATGLSRPLSKYTSALDYSLWIDYRGYIGAETLGENGITAMAKQEVVNGMPLDTWVHLAATDDGTAVKLYINGVAKATTVRNITTLTATSQTVSIGRQDGVGGRQYFNGAIDEVMIYNRTLSASEIDSLYHISAKNLTVSTNANALTALYTGSGSVVVPFGASETIGSLILGSTVVQDGITVTDPGMNSRFNVTTTADIALYTEIAQENVNSSLWGAALGMIATLVVIVFALMALKALKAKDGKLDADAIKTAVSGLVVLSVTLVIGAIILSAF